MTEKGIVFRPLFVVQSNSRTEPLAKLYKKSQFISQANTVSHFTNDLNCRVTKPVLIRRTLLARTTPLDQVKKKSLGMSIFLIDLRDAIANGMEVKPIPNMVNHETNELFFDNLEIPADNLIGEEGMGFRYILDGLNAERTLIAAECIGDGFWFINKVSEYVKDRVVFGRPIGQNQGGTVPHCRSTYRNRSS